ncbi:MULTISPECIES: hypothetical protein [unclassified Streptomyces]|uniref:hypothetical protein n=1 Tax=unclassified Streptomyces TaxID=2593676 RepID=UPI00224F757A|nr:MULTISPECIES: hypothetical protein [unclassified Streptomyces]MCX4526465.1 hypothetical protein [Streptomyces sp. NBC_01551]MCX4542972.1 hypothetical protein [Streptomyces sp. NBC_01565]
MSGQMTLADAYDAVYSAASRMMWVQENRLWRQDSLGGGWPEERRQAWRELEASLSVSEQGLEPQEGEPSDPTRHLISRRAAGPVDRPVTFPEAVAEWQARMAGDPGPYEPRMEPYPDDYLVPGRAVVVPENHMLALTGPFQDLAHRLAPGRPPVTITGDTAELSRLVHEAADGLREALGARVPTPHPTGAVSVARVSHRPSDVDDLQARYDALARAAWRASENVPTLQDIRESGDFSFHPAASKAARDLQDLLAGQSGVFWQEEHDLIDPRVHTVSGVDWPEGQPVATLIAAEAESFGRSVAAGLRPSAPRPGQRRFYREKGEVENVAISAVRAGILAEILDEYAARIHPGAVSGTMHFSAYDLTEFLTSGIGRELRETVGF